MRVIRLKPTDNNVIAAGLENGTIQLWDVLGNVAQKTLFSDNDRVFDLDFTPDSRYLFSGHGSGQIRQWDLESSEKKPIRRILLSPTSFSIAALGIYQPNPNTSRVVIAGQYNKLLLWDWAAGAVYNVIPKPPDNVPQSAQAKHYSQFRASITTSKVWRSLEIGL
ncbi:MAG: hypothetical protein HC769_37505 [Cyanobacteria bacterium CRU_2_1]|nr:hypothetical protein [Cyanobacteria bacterium CRU_2_1]